MRKINKKTLALMLFASVFLFACKSNKINNSVSSTQETQKTVESMAKEDKKDTEDKKDKKEAVKDAQIDWKEFDNDGKLTVGFDKDFPPMGFVGSDGKFTGFDLDLAKEAAKRMGLEIVYQPIAWDAKDMELNSGTIDLIWNGFSINGREDLYLWSEPYMENAQVFVVRKDSKITTFEDLRNKVVEVQIDSSAEAALKDMPEFVEVFKDLRTIPDYNTGFMDLESGAIDALAMDEVVANYQLEIRDNDNFIVLDKSLAQEQYGIAFEKTNKALRNKLQSTLDQMQADGTISEISKQWFGKDVSLYNK